ncbi:MAG: hypothetical protein ACRDOG_15155 [Gaiellaceae bacterium]
MNDIEPLIHKELARLLPRPSASRANWSDVVHRAGTQEVDAGPLRHWPVRSVAAAPRRYILLAVLLVALLGAVGTAVGLGVSFLAEQERVDREPWTPPWSKPTGTRVEVARGADWSFMAWRTQDGLCIAYAAGAATNWGRSCGGPPDVAGDRFSSDYLVATLVTPSDTADGIGAIVGAVTHEVARVELELADGRVLSAPTEESPAALDTDARLFFIRTPLEAPPNPVRAYITYGSRGERLERFPTS